MQHEHGGDKQKGHDQNWNGSTEIKEKKFKIYIATFHVNQLTL